MTFNSPCHQALVLKKLWQTRPPDMDDVWPLDAWNDLCSAGVTRWTIPVEFGGDNLSAPLLLDACLELARGALLPTFVLSQFQAACQRLAIASSADLKQRWLPGLADGTLFATVGISHLTTSRQHVAPAVEAVSIAGGYRLSGEVPWVTGAGRANVIVTGGSLDDGRQILVAISTDRTGVTIGPALSLLALTGSETGSVLLKNVECSADEVIAGSMERVVQQASTGGAGSLITSALAVGHAFGCLDRLDQEDWLNRPPLGSILQSLSAEAHGVRRDLMQAATHPTDLVCTPEELRARATNLALRTSQALLTATKGAGFAKGHPAELLAREALFFLVWSCPQAVVNSLLQNFGGCES